MGKHLQKTILSRGFNFDMGYIGPFPTMFSNVNFKLQGLFGKDLKKKL